MKYFAVLCVVALICVMSAKAGEKEAAAVLETMKTLTNSAKDLTVKVKSLLATGKLEDKTVLEKLKAAGPELGQTEFELAEQMEKLGEFLGIPKEEPPKQQ